MGELKVVDRALANLDRRRTAAPLPGFSTADLFGDYQPPSYIVKGIVEPGELAVWFGESGAMKSFAVVDLALHIATGKAYAGHRVIHNGVLIIAGEGGEGIKRRIKAWMIRHGIGMDDCQPAIYCATQPANLMFDEGTVRSTVMEAEKIIGSPIGVVVFDTLAASFGDGDENATSDMTRALQTARMACGDGRAIILVHHVGHGDKGRERGSYALRAAADRRVLVERPGDGRVVSLTCAKAKDGEPFSQITFEWRQVEIGWFDADGDQLTSVVLEPTDRVPEKQPPNGRVQRAVIATIQEQGAARRADIARRLEPMGFNRASVYRAIAQMLESGQVLEGFDKVSLPDVQ